MPHILKALFHQDYNVGLYGFSNDKFCLLASNVNSKLKKEIEKVLDVPVYCMNLCGTSLLGIFVAGNNKRIIIPEIAFDSEIALIRNKELPLSILETKHTALGNNIVANDFACLINPELNSQKEEIKELLEVEKIKPLSIGEIQTIGSLLVVTGRGAMLSPFASQKEADFIEKFFEVPVARGTVNLGTPFVRSGIIANSHGFVFGGNTGGPEAMAIDEALGFV